MQILGYVLSGAAIVIMGLNIWLVSTLLAKFKGGGQVGNRIKWLVALISIFFAGYIVSPFLVALDISGPWLIILVFGVFFLGAVYVTITLTILRKILSLLDFVKKSGPKSKEE